MEVHPQHAFRSLPDFSESTIFFLLLLVVFILLDIAHASVAALFMLSYVAAEWLYETLAHIDLAAEWGLPFTALVGLETCIVRTWAEIGRFKGQMERGTLLQGITWRFDWFQENWPEYRHIERMRALKRGTFRLAIASLAAYSAGGLFVQ